MADRIEHLREVARSLDKLHPLADVDKLRMAVQDTLFIIAEELEYLRREGE